MGENARKRPSHGTIAGYLGLLCGVLALTGGPSYAAQVIDGSVLRPGSVKASKLGDNSVTSAKLRKNAVTAVKLARNAVTSRSISDKSITAGMLAAGAVTSASVASGSIQASDLSRATLDLLQAPATSATIAASAVTGDKLADGAVTTDKLAAGAVTGTRVPLHVVTANATIAVASSVSATALCPEGARAFGGGATIDDSATLALLTAVRQSQPVVNAGGSPIGWTGTAVGLAALPAATQFHVYAICG